MALASERTCWAEGLGLTEEQIEALTLIGEEAAARNTSRYLDLNPRDVWGAWPPALREAGLADLAERVERLGAES